MTTKEHNNNSHQKPSHGVVPPEKLWFIKHFMFLKAMHYRKVIWSQGWTRIGHRIFGTFRRKNVDQKLHEDRNYLTIILSNRTCVYHKNRNSSPLYIRSLSFSGMQSESGLKSSSMLNMKPHPKCCVYFTWNKICLTHRVSKNICRLEI